MFRFAGSLMVAASFVAFSALAPSTASASHCGPAPCCEPVVVCCPPPPPVQVCICVVDPCTGCTYTATVCVPACCAGEVPCLAGWRKGIFGRKVLTYKWPGCGHCVDIVLTKHGRVIVRG